MMKLAILLVVASGQLATAARSPSKTATYGVPANVASPITTIRPPPPALLPCATAVDRKAFGRGPAQRLDLLACIPTVIDARARDVDEETAPAPTHAVRRSAPRTTDNVMKILYGESHPAPVQPSDQPNRQPL